MWKKKRRKKEKKMAKRIFASDAEIASIIEEVRNQLSGKRVFGEVSIKKSLSIQNAGKAQIVFSADAWVKMTTLVKSYDSEVEWHGTVERLDRNKWRINDILVFPHTVAAATVTADQAEYEAWLSTLDDDTFNSLRYHGHSHVNMGVSPSGVDMTYREDVVSTLQAPADGVDSYYIFLILNKKGEWSGEVYDLTNNTLYEKSDIEIDIEVSGFDTVSKFVEDARTKAKKAEPVKTIPAVTSGLTDKKPDKSKAMVDKKQTAGYTNGSDYYSRFAHSPYDDDDDRYYGSVYSYK